MSDAHGAPPARRSIAWTRNRLCVPLVTIGPRKNLLPNLFAVTVPEAYGNEISSFPTGQPLVKPVKPLI